MRYYYILDIIPNYVLEDLETSKKVSFERISHAVFRNAQHKKASVIKILPADFKLSKFRSPNDRYLFKGEDRCLLYDLSNLLEPFTEESNIEKDSIIELSDWE